MWPLLSVLQHQPRRQFARREYDAGMDEKRCSLNYSPLSIRIGGRPGRKPAILGNEQICICVCAFKIYVLLSWLFFGAPISDLDRGDDSNSFVCAWRNICPVSSAVRVLRWISPSNITCLTCTSTPLSTIHRVCWPTHRPLPHQSFVAIATEMCHYNVVVQCIYIYRRASCICHINM